MPGTSPASAHWPQLRGARGVLTWLARARRPCTAAARGSGHSCSHTLSAPAPPPGRASAAQHWCTYVLPAAGPGSSASCTDASAQTAGRPGRAGPRSGAPDGLAQRALGQVDRKRVGGHGGDEHAGRDARRLEQRLHDVRAHLLLRAILLRGARGTRRHVPYFTLTLPQRFACLHACVRAVLFCAARAAPRRHALRRRAPARGPACPPACARPCWHTSAPLPVPDAVSRNTFTRYSTTPGLSPSTHGGRARSSESAARHGGAAAAERGSLVRQRSAAARPGRSRTGSEPQARHSALASGKKMPPARAATDGIAGASSASANTSE